MRMFDQQVKQRDQQLSFNQRAFNTAIEQQNVLKEEALIGFMFDDAEQLNMDIKNEFLVPNVHLNMKGSSTAPIKISSSL